MAWRLVFNNGELFALEKGLVVVAGWDDEEVGCGWGWVGLWTFWPDPASRLDLGLDLVAS